MLLFSLQAASVNRAPKIENFNNIKQYSSASALSTSVEVSCCFPAKLLQVFLGTSGRCLMGPKDHFLLSSLRSDDQSELSLQPWDPSPRKCPAGPCGWVSLMLTWLGPFGTFLQSCCCTIACCLAGPHWWCTGASQAATLCRVLHWTDETFTCSFGLDSFREPWDFVVCCALICYLVFC